MQTKNRQLTRAQISRYFREGNRLINRAVSEDARLYPFGYFGERFEAFFLKLKRDGLENVATYFNRAYGEAEARAVRDYIRPRYRLELTGELVSIYDLDREFLN